MGILFKKNKDYVSPIDELLETIDAKETTSQIKEKNKHQIISEQRD